MYYSHTVMYTGVTGVFLSHSNDVYRSQNNKDDGMFLSVPGELYRLEVPPVRVA